MQPRRAALVAAVALAACGGFISPLKNRLAVGEESYLVFVGDGENGQGDLYAVSTGGGTVYRMTYSRVAEGHPALSPDGLRLAFTRARRAADTTDRTVWIMNLEDGAEHEVPLPDAARPGALAWSGDGNWLFIMTDGGTLVYDRDRDQVEPGGPQAGVALEPRAGPPPGRRLYTSAEGGVWVDGDSGRIMLAPRARDPMRWGEDSLAYFVQDEVYVRPLAGGRVRVVPWRDAPTHPRQATIFLLPTSKD